MPRTPILRWIWLYLRPYRRHVVALCGLSIAEVALRVLTPWPMKAVIDHVLGAVPPPPWFHGALIGLQPILKLAGGGNEQMLAAVVAAGLAIQLAHQAVMMFHARLSSVAGHRMVRDLRGELFAHIQLLRLSDHVRRPTGDIIHRLEIDACCLEHLVMRGLFPIVFSALTLIAMFVVLAGIDLPLAIVSLGIVPLLFGWLRFYTHRMQPGARRAKELDAAVLQRLHEAMSSIRIVKSYAREDFERERFVEATHRATDARVDTSHREVLFGSVVSALTIAGMAVVLLVGGLSVIHGRISLGTLTLVVAYLGFIYGPLCGIANTTGALQQAIASARRVRETLEEATEPLEATSGFDASHVRGDVVFERVSFAYEGGTRVLEDLSFTARAGETIALVGLSGAGKTTAVSLLTRLHDVTAGRILIDGVDVRAYNLRSLRRAVASVLQDPVLMSGSIRDNIRYGRLEATDAEIEAAACAAHAEEFIEATPGGYDTVLGEGGKGLSGGQRQRLSIARAFLKDAPILLLDEPTSSLDAVSETLVLDGLRHLQKGRTTFVIAHRLSTIRAADRILVLDHGRIVAHGTHEELLACSSLYRALAQQLTDGEVPDQAVGSCDGLLKHAAAR